MLKSPNPPVDRLRFSQSTVMAQLVALLEVATGLSAEACLELKRQAKKDGTPWPDKTPTKKGS